MLSAIRRLHLYCLSVPPAFACVTRMRRPNSLHSIYPSLSIMLTLHTPASLRGGVYKAQELRYMDLAWRRKPIYYGWIIAATLAVTQTISWGVLYYSFSVFLTSFESDLGFSRTTIT